MTANGNPLTQMPVPQDDKKTRYSFLFPLRPGTTQFEVAYQLPYSGSANIDPKSVYPLQHFVAILPKSMEFTAASGANYQPMNDPQQADANVQVVSGTAAGQSLAFKVSGEGVLQARNESGGQPSAPSAQGGGGGQAEDRPGGGLGPPIDAPDPLQKYRWYILGGFAVALVGGGVYVASRQQAAARGGVVGKGKKKRDRVEEEDFDEYEEPDTPPVRETRTSPARPQPAAPVVHAPAAVAVAAAPAAVPFAAATSSASMLLQGLKEELFQLEVEHQQGRITREEYDRTKAALDQTLQRALKREAAK
jgi:hypothetical protein